MSNELTQLEEALKHLGDGLQSLMAELTPVMREQDTVEAGQTGQTTGPPVPVRCALSYRLFRLRERVEAMSHETVTRMRADLHL